MTATKPKRYTVTQGISPKPGAPWFVAEVKPNGSMRRVSSKHLPLRETREEAEDDLALWLAKRCYGQCPAEAAPYWGAYNELREKRAKRNEHTETTLTTLSGPSEPLLR